MRWPRRRRKVDARDMQIISITGAISSPPTFAKGTLSVQPPTFAKGTITVVKNLSGVFFIVEDDTE